MLIFNHLNRLELRVLRSIFGNYSRFRKADFPTRLRILRRPPRRGGARFFQEIIGGGAETIKLGMFLQNS
jgi:hypothetical protein